MNRGKIELAKPSRTVHRTGCISRIYTLKCEKILHTVGWYPKPWDPFNPHKVDEDYLLQCFFEGNDSFQTHLRLERENILSNFDITFFDSPDCESKRSFTIKSKDLFSVLSVLDAWV